MERKGSREEYARVVSGTWAGAEGFDKFDRVGKRNAALAAALVQKLIKQFDVSPPPPVVTSNTRKRSWLRGHQFVVSTQQNWHDVNHDFSHWLHSLRSPELRPHDAKQLLIERVGAEFFVEKLNRAASLEPDFLNTLPVPEWAKRRNHEAAIDRHAKRVQKLRAEATALRVERRELERVIDRKLELASERLANAKRRKAKFEASTYKTERKER